MNLSVPRGDTLAFGFEIDGVTDIDTAYFSVKKSEDEVSYSFQKSLNNGIVKVEDGKYSVRVAPSDTYNLELGQYVYDLEIGVNDDVFTLLSGILTLEYDVTREE